MRDIENVIMRPKIVNLLMEISNRGESSISDIAHACKITYSHTFKIISLLNGTLIDMPPRKTKRSYRVKLTEKGIQVAHNLFQIRTLLK